MDESGVDESGVLILTAVSILDAQLQDLEAELVDLKATLGELAPAFERWPEWHGQELAAGVTSSERNRLIRRQEPCFEDFQRCFVYRTAVRHLANSPSCFIYTLHWSWKTGEVNKDRFEIALTRLLDWVDEHKYPISRISCDRGHERAYGRAIEKAEAKRSEVWLGPRFVDSRDEVLVQLADLAAYTAFQDVTRKQKGNKEHMVDWYRHDACVAWAPDGDGHGYRRYSGKRCEPK